MVYRYDKEVKVLTSLSYPNKCLETNDLRHYKQSARQPQPSGDKINEQRAAKAPNTQQVTVVEYIKENGSITTEEIQTALGVKQTRSYAIIKEMVSQGLIQADGKGINKKYILTE